MSASTRPVSSGLRRGLKRSPDIPADVDVEVRDERAEISAETCTDVAAFAAINRVAPW
jgi:hypothetical protein